MEIQGAWRSAAGIKAEAGAEGHLERAAGQGLALLGGAAGFGSARAEEPSVPADAELAAIAELQLDAAERSRFERPAEDPALAARLAARERGAGSATRSFRTEVGTEQGLYDVALRYRLGARESAVADPGTVTVIPYAGIRIVDVGLSIDSILSSSRGRQRAVSRSYGAPEVQPLLGTQAQVFVAPRLRLFARGDAAGFGIGGADGFSANAQVGLGYAVGNSTQINLSWHYLTMAADNGRQRPNAY
jgi:hypothetical protein